MWQLCIDAVKLVFLLPLLYDCAESFCVLLQWRALSLSSSLSGLISHAHLFTLLYHMITVFFFGGGLPFFTTKWLQVPTLNSVLTNNAIRMQELNFCETSKDISGIVAAWAKIRTKITQKQLKKNVILYIIKGKGGKVKTHLWLSIHLFAFFFSEELRLCYSLKMFTKLQFLSCLVLFYKTRRCYKMVPKSCFFRKVVIGVKEVCWGNIMRLLKDLLYCMSGK